MSTETIRNMTMAAVVAVLLSTNVGAVASLTGPGA